MKNLHSRPASPWPFVLSMALLVFAITFATSPSLRAQVSSYFSFDSSHNLKVNCASGCSAGASIPLPGGSNTAAAANQSVGIQAYDGSTNMVPLQESSGSLKVNCTSGCGGSGGAPLTGGSQNVATASGQSTAIHGFNGTTLDAINEGASLPSVWLTTTITGSGSPQSVPVNESTTIPINSYVSVEGDTVASPGLSNAEIVQVTAKADSTHITGIFTKNHNNGTVIEMVGTLDIRGTMSLAGDTLGTGGQGSPNLLASGTQGLVTGSVLYGRSSGNSQEFDKLWDDSGTLRVGLYNGTNQMQQGNNWGQSGWMPGSNGLEIETELYGYNGSNLDALRDRLGQLEVTEGGHQNTKVTATSCTSGSTSASEVAKVWSAAGSETATVSLYNEGSSPTCAAADLIWSGIPSTTPTPLGIYFSSGWAYKLSGTAVNNDYVSTN